MSPDMLQFLVAVGSVLEPLLWFIIALSTMGGVFITGSGLFTAYLLGNPDSRWRGRNESSHGGVIANLIIGPILTMPIFMITVFGNTMLNTDVSGAFGYPTVGPSPAQQQAIATLFGLFQVMGVCAFCWGWVIMNKFYSGSSSESWWSGFWRILAGAAMVYLNAVLDLLQGFIGINFVGMVFS